MKKLIAIAMAILLALSVVSSMAFISRNDSSKSAPVEIISVKAVDLAAGITGIKAYTALVDSARTYSAGELIRIAVTIRVFNTWGNYSGAYRDDFKWCYDIFVTGDTVDLSYANYAEAVVTTDYTIGGAPIATIANDASAAVAYDEENNAITIFFMPAEHAIDMTTDMFALPGSTASNMFALNQNAAWVGDDPKTSAVEQYPFITMPWFCSDKVYAPKFIDYTVILTAMTEEASKGSLEAKLLSPDSERWSYFGQENESDGLLLLAGDYLVMKRTHVKTASNTDLLTDVVSYDIYAYTKAMGSGGDFSIAFPEDFRHYICTLSTYGCNTDPLATSIGLFYTYPTFDVMNDAIYPKDEVRFLGDFNHTFIPLQDVSIYNGGEVLKAGESYSPFSGATNYSASVAAMYNALQYFGFSLGQNAGYPITNADFSAKAAGMLYLDGVTGSYNMGLAEIYPDVVEEATEEDVEVIKEEGDEDEEVVATDDAAIAFACAVLALVAATGFAVIAKRTR